MQHCSCGKPKPFTINKNLIVTIYFFVVYSSTFTVFYYFCCGSSSLARVLITIQHLSYLMHSASQPASCLIKHCRELNVNCSIIMEWIFILFFIFMIILFLSFVFTAATWNFHWLWEFNYCLTFFFFVVVSPSICVLLAN